MLPKDLQILVVVNIVVLLLLVLLIKLGSVVVIEMVFLTIVPILKYFLVL